MKIEAEVLTEARAIVAEAETYAQRLEVFRARLIISLGVVGALGSLYLAAPLTETFPYPLSIAVPFGAIGLGFAVGTIAGEILLIAAAELTTRLRN